MSFVSSLLQNRARATPTRILSALLAIGILCAPMASPALAPPVILPIADPAEGESHRIVWATGQGLRYELQQSTDLENWTVVTGFPREATGLIEQHAFRAQGDKLFFRIRLLDTGPAPDGFSRILAGTYSRGDYFHEPESWMERSRPVHDIYVSEFFLAETPVTYGEWEDVYFWAIANGYSFDNAGQRGSDAAFNGLPPSAQNDLHPVVQINWYDMVKWCNARSEMEGLLPVYYQNEGLTSVYRTGHLALTKEQVNWEANGYRLPTSAEWEKAARGGLEKKRWFWGDEEIDGPRANYRDSTETNGTTAVGTFLPNSYGLYDIVGNVWELCWDWFDADWYSQAGASEPDSRGPASGSLRVGRGGSWNFSPAYCRMGYFGASNPESRGNSWGFRVARTE